MNDTTKPKAEKARNYSAEQEQAIVLASPINLEIAKALGEELGKSYRSIIAKAQSMDNVVYVSKPPPKKRIAEVTKKELVQQIAERMEVPKGSFQGLEKATVKALKELHDCIELMQICTSIPSPTD